jgi:RES domain-containing protein
MIVHRLTRSVYARDLSGRGAEKYGGRWNTPGVPMLYTSDSRALSTLELLVHTGRYSCPKDLVLISLEIPDDIRIHSVYLPILPEGWDTYPYSTATRNFGDQFIRDKRMLAMKVPSVMVPGEFNLLINPLHEEIKQLSIIEEIALHLNDRLFV